jgi:hypothetical protein
VGIALRLSMIAKKNGSGEADLEAMFFSNASS